MESYVEHQLPSDLMLSVGYVGNHFVHEFNGTGPGRSPVIRRSANLCGGVQRTGGTYQFLGDLDSHYNSLQVSVSHRNSNGLFLQAAYTYSKAMGYVNDNTWLGYLEFNCPPSAAMPRGCRSSELRPFELR